MQCVIWKKREDLGASGGREMEGLELESLRSSWAGSVGKYTVQAVGEARLKSARRRRRRSGPGRSLTRLAVVMLSPAGGRKDGGSGGVVGEAEGSAGAQEAECRAVRGREGHNGRGCHGREGSGAACGELDKTTRKGLFFELELAGDGWWRSGGEFTRRIPPA